MHGCAETTVVTLFRLGELGENLAQSGVEVINLGLTKPFRGPTIREGVAKLAEICLCRSIQVVHAHLVASGFYGGLVARRLSLPCVYTVHGRSADFRLRVLECAVATLFDRVVVVSTNTADARPFLKQIVRGKLRLCYNGVDAQAWARPAVSAEQRALTSDDITLVMVGNFTKEKDHGTLIRAFQILRQDHPECRLILAGAGPLKAAFERHVASCCLEGVVFAGRVDNVKELLWAADIFVLSTRTEGLSIAVLEALSVGLPVVATDVPGNREVLDDGNAGFLFPPGDAEALSKELRRLIRNPENAEEAKRNGLQLVRERFSLDGMARGYEGVYRDAIRDRGQNAADEVPSR